MERTQQSETKQRTVWSEFGTPDATTDRGWLKAITAPWSRENVLDYTNETMPVWDAEIGEWREQSTLGNYLDYGPCRADYSAESLARLYPDGNVHAVCYASQTSKYFSTVADAKAWIESEAMRVRPNLVFQQAFAFIAA